MSGKTLEDIWGMEADWLACDADYRVAVFSTAGSGFAPQEYLDDIDVHHSAIKAILNRPPSTRARLVAAAEQGLYAFDNDPSGGPYTLVAAPERATTVGELPAELTPLIARIRFRTLRFADHNVLSNADVERHLKA
jgi:hypothetical protein